MTLSHSLAKSDLDRELAELDAPYRGGLRRPASADRAALRPRPAVICAKPPSTEGETVRTGGYP
jgi:hypothetical protein